MTQVPQSTTVAQLVSFFNFPLFTHYHIWGTARALMCHFHPNTNSLVPNIAAEGQDDE